VQENFTHNEERHSRDLVMRLVIYFKDFHGLDVSYETAVEYLNSLADLFLSFAQGAGDGRRRPEAKGEGRLRRKMS